MKTITPYLIFDGNCREAMAFYQQVLGGELQQMSFGESPEKVPPGAEDRLIHARLARGETLLMASDNMPGMPYRQGDNVWLSLECESAEEVDTLFAGLSDGGSAVMPPNDTFWGAYFAMLTDRFGVCWMLNHARPGAGAQPPG